MICYQFVITFLNESKPFFWTQVNGFKYFYLIEIILFTSYLFFCTKVNDFKICLHTV